MQIPTATLNPFFGNINDFRQCSSQLSSSIVTWEREREREREIWTPKIFIYPKNSNPHINCVGQFCPMFKLCGRRPGPILSSFIQIEQGRAQPNIQCEGKRISEDSQPRNGQNYHPRRMVTSGLLSEVSGELVNHSKQRLGQIL